MPAEEVILLLLARHDEGCSQPHLLQGGEIVQLCCSAVLAVAAAYWIGSVPLHHGSMFAATIVALRSRKVLFPPNTQ